MLAKGGKQRQHRRKSVRLCSQYAFYYICRCLLLDECGGDNRASVLGMCLGDCCWIHDLHGSSRGECTEIEESSESCQGAESYEGYEKEASGLAQEDAWWLP